MCWLTGRDFLHCLTVLYYCLLFGMKKVCFSACAFICYAVIACVSFRHTKCRRRRGQVSWNSVYHTSRGCISQNHQGGQLQLYTEPYQAQDLVESTASCVSSMLAKHERGSLPGLNKRKPRSWWCGDLLTPGEHLVAGSGQSHGVYGALGLWGSWWQQRKKGPSNKGPKMAFIGLWADLWKSCGAFWKHQQWLWLRSAVRWMLKGSFTQLWILSELHAVHLVLT